VRMEEIERFLAGPSLADATRKAYRSDLEQFGAWLERRGLTLEDVEVRVLTEYAAELGRGRPKLAPASVARKLSAVRSLLAYALGPARVPDGSRRHPCRRHSGRHAAGVVDTMTRPSTIETS